MKLILYSLPECIHAKAMKIFLERNNLPYKEIKINNQNINELKKISFQDKVSALKVIKSSSISVITGFDEHNLKLNII